MVEEWRKVKGFEEHYEVSSLGRVKSLERKVFNGHGFRIVKERILKQCSIKYCAITLSLNEIKTKVPIHKLMAIAFLNHTPCGYKLVVDHIDNNKFNNNINNLQIITQRENTTKDKKNKTSKYRGVSFYKSSGKFRSAISFNGKTFHLGYFNSEEEASKAYENKFKTL
jgi:hypothetical protein